jgi:hypothetical protein
MSHKQEAYSKPFNACVGTACHHSSHSPESAAAAALSKAQVKSKKKSSQLVLQIASCQ